jgi:ubiquinone/menaquinone biosynthesis C-methylase UbiE
MNDNSGVWLTSAEPGASEAIAPMSSKLALEQPEVSSSNGARTHDDSQSLFEQVPWLYVFCRENLFRDDTDRIRRALWPAGPPPPETKLIELGCGPGFYSCRLAQRYPQISVVGVDRADRQLAWARGRARNLGLRNCRFDRVNVLEIPYAESYFDALIASRLFTVLAERELAIAEMHRVLQPGGRCMIAEPRHAFRASVPLIAMWILARATHLGNGYREPRKAHVIEFEDFSRLCVTQPWKKCRCWQDGRYQYALCEKA